MGAQVSRNDFEWIETTEPHTNRRNEILKKYPEIKRLMGHEPRMKWIVSTMVFMQFITMYLLKDASWTTILVSAYFFGGIINHSLTLALHEIGHNLAFGQSALAKNRYFGIFANLPLGLPIFCAFKKYHRDHHKYLGIDGKDPDLPTKLEALMFTRTFTKIIWICCYSLVYAFRPLFSCPKAITLHEIENIFIQIVFDFIIYQTLGWRMLFYMVFTTLIASGPHPIAGHMIAEHYMFEKGYETYSYYGPFNLITFNVGYHMEHHDFPYIPYSRLPEIKRIASEYYDNLPQHNSWLRVFYDFVTDPTLGPYARHKRMDLTKDMEPLGNTNNRGKKITHGCVN